MHAAVRGGAAQAESGQLHLWVAAAASVITTSASSAAAAATSQGGGSGGGGGGGTEGEGGGTGGVRIVEACHAALCALSGDYTLVGDDPAAVASLRLVETMRTAALKARTGNQFRLGVKVAHYQNKLQAEVGRCNLNLG